MFFSKLSCQSLVPVTIVCNMQCQIVVTLNEAKKGNKSRKIYTIKLHKTKSEQQLLSCFRQKPPFLSDRYAFACCSHFKGQLAQVPIYIIPICLSQCFKKGSFLRDAVLFHPSRRTIAFTQLEQPFFGKRIRGKCQRNAQRKFLQRYGYKKNELIFIFGFHKQLRVQNDVS